MTEHLRSRFGGRFWVTKHLRSGFGDRFWVTEHLRYRFGDRDRVMIEVRIGFGAHFGLQIPDSRFRSRIWGLGSRIRGLRSRIRDPFWTSDVGFGVGSGFGGRFRVEIGSRSRISVLGSQILDLRCWISGSRSDSGVGFRSSDVGYRGSSIQFRSSSRDRGLEIEGRGTPKLRF